MKIQWIPLVFLPLLALGSCGPSQTVVENSPTLAPKDTDTVSPVAADATAVLAAGGTMAVANSTVIVTDAWETYHNAQAGYSAKYPVDWTVNESIGISGELITTFMAPNDGQGIAVSVLNGEAAVEEIPDMPNTRCQQITISGLPGRRCFDTVALSISTTFLGPGKQYAIAAIGKHPDQNIYQHFLESFTVTP